MKRRFKRARLMENAWSEPEANPVESLLNLTDVMLILAVGIMLALVLNWRVDITAVTAGQTAAAAEFTQDDMQSTDAEPLTDEMEKMGTVYYDEKTDTYYIVGEGG
jgi:hypothetical protein